jgi:hypothetical protein
MGRVRGTIEEEQERSDSSGRVGEGRRGSKGWVGEEGQ